MISLQSVVEAQWETLLLITAEAEDEGRGRAQARQSWRKAERVKRRGSGKGEVKEMNTVCGDVRHVTTR